MALPNLSDHCKTTAVRNYNPITIGDRRVVSRDRGNPVARRFEYMGEGVRPLRHGDSINDVAGVTVSQIERTEDPERPAAGGLGPGVLATQGFAWVRLIGPANGSQPNWDRLDLATDGDDLGVIADAGRDNGAVRRAIKGDLVVGSAICVDDGVALVRLKLAS